MFFVSGLCATLLIFNQIYIGTNFSIIWLLIILAPLFSHKFKIYRRFTGLQLLLLLFLLKFIIALNGAAVIRYLTYIAFFGIGTASMRRNHFDEFFKGFHWGLGINFVFACVQVIGRLTKSYTATLPVEIWNPVLWHAILDDGMLSFYPRVSGFTLEPAYLGTLLIIAAGYRMFIQHRPVFSGLYGLYLSFSIVLLVNSRTTFFAYGWLVVCKLLTKLKGGVITNAAVSIIYISSFILIPLTIILRTDTADLKVVADDDISVFARIVPLTWIRDGNGLSFGNYIFGVGDYRAYAETVSMPSVIYALFSYQGGLLDSKSLGGAYFFDFGLIGLVLFMLSVAMACRWNRFGLLYASLINIAFFNVYAFSWPLFWLALMACGLTGGSIVHGSAATKSRRRSDHVNKIEPLPLTGTMKCSTSR